jgi:hypothetical protein
MLRRLSAGILVLAGLIILAVLPLAVVPVYADTGTYKINDYVVTLVPQNDGRVLITVEQKWQVLSGSIPWVTVGLPNHYFEIQDFSGAASSVSDGSGSGFYGVRVDLDKDYQPGQTFNIKFTVLQGHIIDRLPDQSLWRIDYTPGWYDYATIDHLKVSIISPVPYESYLSTSPLLVVAGNTLSWEKTNLGPGQRLDVKVESADGSFLTAAEPDVSSGSGGGGLGTGFWIIVGIVVVIGLLVVGSVAWNRKQQEAYIRSKATAIEDEMAKNPEKQKEVDEKFKEYVEKKNLEPDAQGRYFDRSRGDYITPAIWWAILASQQRNNVITPPGSSGASHTTRPGCVSCACVSCACACACACAGGGAAGCSRKTLHEFRMSQTKKEEKEATAKN